MKIRLIIYLVLTLFAAYGFAVSPFFNWTGESNLSLLEQYQVTGNYLGLFVHVGVMSLFVFVGLILLFGLSPKKTQEEE